MTTNEWLAERRKGLGGSDAGAVCGMNRYRSALDVYCDKLSLIPPKADNEAMRLGRDLEDYVARRFSAETGKKVHRVKRDGGFIRNPKYPFAFANVDRLIYGEKAGLECKTASALNLKRFGETEFPEEYYCQCVHYLAVTGLEKWYLAALVLGREFKIYEITRDDDEIAALMETERSFWEDHVQKRNPPAPAAGDGETIAALFPGGGESVHLFGFSERLERRAEIDALIRRLKGERDTIDNEIKAFMKNAEIAENDRYRVSWKAHERRSLDLAALVEDYDIEDIDDYYTSKTYRKFDVKEQGE